MANEQQLYIKTLDALTKNHNEQLALETIPDLAERYPELHNTFLKPSSSLTKPEKIRLEKLGDKYHDAALYLIREQECIPVYSQKQFTEGLAYLNKNPSENDILNAFAKHTHNFKDNQISISPDIALHEYTQFVIDTVHDTITTQRNSEHFAENLRDAIYNSSWLQEDYDFQTDDICKQTFTTLKKAFPNMTNLHDWNDLYRFAENKSLFAQELPSNTASIEIPLVCTINSEKLPSKYSAAHYPQLEDIDHSLEKYTLLNYLVQNQGKSKKDFSNLLTEIPKNPFLKSIREELNNTTSDSNRLAFFISLPLKNINDVFTDRESTTAGITIPKNTKCGLYDPWAGGGSLLNISLEKDFNIPLPYIEHLHPDQTTLYGYSVKDIYGEAPDYTPASYKKYLFPLINANLFIHKTTDYLADHLLNNTSVLTKIRKENTVDYSINSSTGKPFTGINQLLAQQFRHEHHFTNPNFSPITGKPDETIKPGEKALILTKPDSTQEMYYNHDQFINCPNVSYKPVPLKLAIKDIQPMETTKLWSNPKPVEVYKSNYRQDPQAILQHTVNNYYKSIFQGDPYNYDTYFIERTSELAKKMIAGDTSIIQACQKASVFAKPKQNTKQQQHTHARSSK